MTFEESVISSSHSTSPQNCFCTLFLLRYRDTRDKNRNVFPELNLLPSDFIRSNMQTSDEDGPLNTSSETKETKLTFREKFLIAAGSLTFLMIMMLIRHPELYREDSHSNLRNPNAGAVALEDNSIYGWADPVATQQLSSLNLDRSIGTYNMDYRGLTLSSVGIGTYLADNSDADSGTLTAAIYISVMNGINVIDTSISNQGMRSELCVGTALKRLISSGVVMRDSLFISTKGGFIPADSVKGTNSLRTASEWATEISKRGQFPNAEIVGGKHCISPVCLKASLELSRNNLGLQTIDLYYLDNAAEIHIGAVTDVEFKTRLEASFTFLEGQRKLNKIRYYGMASESSFTIDQSSEGYLSLSDVTKIAELAGGPNHGFRYVQVPVALSIPEAIKKRAQLTNTKQMTFLESAAALNITVMSSRSIGGASYQSLSSTETVYKSCLVNELEYSSQLASKMLLISSKGGGRSKSTRKVAHLSQAAISLLVTRSIPGITTALVGMKLGNHVKENVNILNLPLIPNSVMSNCILMKEANFTVSQPLSAHEKHADKFRNINSHSRSKKLPEKTSRGSQKKRKRARSRKPLTTR